MTDCRRPVCETACAAAPARPIGVPQQVFRLAALLLALGAGALLLALVTALPGYRRRRRGAWALQQMSRWVLRSLGIRRTVHGAPRSGPSLVVGNHVSWLDILVLGGCAPMLMVAKSDVRGWPLVGPFAVRVGSIFLDRNRLRTLPDTVAEMTSALRSGMRVQVFPEGTTRCGGAVGEFSRAAFQAAIAAAVVVSPVTLRYTDDQQAPTTTPAFVGTESLLDSFRRVVAAPRIEVTVRWLAPIPAIAGTGRDHLDRATVARLAQRAVAARLGIPVVSRTGDNSGVVVAPTADLSSRWSRPVGPR